jgi:hypothetical protein
MYDLIENKPHHVPWNKGKLIGQKAPLKPQQIWGIRIHGSGITLSALRLYNLALATHVASRFCAFGEYSANMLSRYLALNLWRTCRTKR